MVMPKTRPLYTGASLNLRDRVLSEVEKNGFIALPGKHSRLMPSKMCVPKKKKKCPNPGGFGECYSSGSRVGVTDQIRVCTPLIWL